MRTILAAVILTVFAPSAFAHALYVDCNLRGDRVVVKAYFEGELPAPKANVKVMNAEKQLVFSGETDDKGLWSFPRPAAGKYTITVADTGHRAMQEIDVPAQPEDAKEPSVAPVAPTREEMSGIPWLKIAIGLAVIVGLGGAFLLASMLRKKA